MAPIVSTVEPLALNRHHHCGVIPSTLEVDLTLEVNGHILMLVKKESIDSHHIMKGQLSYRQFVQPDVYLLNRYPASGGGQF